MKYRSINPANEELIKEYTSEDYSITSHKLEKADYAFREYRYTDSDLRAQCLRKAASILKKRREQYAKLMSSEMGKPVTQALAEADKCALVCNYYADNLHEFLQPVEYKSDFNISKTKFEPLGVILGIMPWNFPFWQFFRFAVPALAAGNAVILKHAENVPGCARAIEDLMQSSGLPENTVQNILAEREDIEKVIASDIIQGVSLTGSNRAGSSVAQLAGRYMKKTVFELGGSDPYIVLPDADIEKAAVTCAASRMINNGESCIAAKRFIVHESISEQFTEKMISELAQFKAGDPLDENTRLGPIARADLLDNLIRQVEESVDAGAQILHGIGRKVDRSGYYFEPVVLSGISPDMPVWNEETFGPVAPIVTFKDNDEAVKLANGSEYGLGAAVFTTEGEQIDYFTRELEAGNVFVNDSVKSDPRLPFGGIKNSGIGRELSLFGIREFTNQKTIAGYFSLK